MADLNIKIHTIEPFISSHPFFLNPMFYIIANDSGQRDLAHTVRTKAQAITWINRVIADWPAAPVFTIEAEAPPTEPEWFSSEGLW